MHGIGRNPGQIVTNIRSGRIAVLDNGFNDDEPVTLGGLDVDGPDVGYFPDNTMVLIVCEGTLVEGIEARWIVMTPAGQLGWVYDRELRL